MATRLISLRGEIAWKGQQSLHVTDRGERAFTRLENCYVSRDGTELRQFPGFFTLWDNTAVNNPNGWAGRTIREAVRPLWGSAPSAPYQFAYQETAGDNVPQSLYSRALPVCFHGFEQVGNQIVLWGETRFREVPLYSAARVELTIVQAGVVAGEWVLRLSGNVAGNSLRDSTGAGLNGAHVGDPVHVANITITGDAALNAVAQTELVGKVHEIKAISGTDITLTSLSSSSTGLTVCTGAVYRVRPKRSNSYPTTAGGQHSVYAPNHDDRPDDPNALTSWRIIDALGPTQLGAFDPLATCYPAHVANRRRDFGDKQSVLDDEGFIKTGTRGASRREGRELPYRTCPDAAGDRLLLAAPGYSCMFQVPLRVPTNPQNHPAAPTNPSLGISIRTNDLFDQPRALGIPKARLIEAFNTTPPTSPSFPEPYQFALVARTGAHTLGLGEGTWRMAISFEDEATGDEGLASEPIEVEVPSPSSPTNTYYQLRVNYIHPGYIMPECLALRMNVYLAPPGQDALAFYGSFLLAANPLVGDTADSAAPVPTNFNTSGHYGFEPSTSTNAPLLYMRTFELPLLGDGASVADQLDPSRLAPLSASMPRGSDACRYLRGVLLAGGNTGNLGANTQLWESRASARYEPGDTYDQQDAFQIRTHGTNWDIPNGTMDGDSASSVFGGGGRCFPDGYQGVEVVSRDLFPNTVWHRIDRVLNRRGSSITAAIGTSHWQHERIRLTRAIYNRSRSGGAAPAVAITNQENKPIFYVEPKGQLQIGDPGAPHRSSKAAIQFIDANRGDDVTAIGALGSTAIICTRKETWSMGWYRNASGEQPSLMTNEHGCIAANSMVEFDGGIAWIGERGPVAIGDGLQFVGADLERDFTGDNARYLTDSTGLMRHTWGCHDAARGIVMWGFVTGERVVTLNTNGTQVSFLTANDRIKSRFPCDEVLIWSYRTNAFSTWRPPAGLEVYWMRPVRCADGVVRVTFLAADGCLYALDDDAHDTTYPSQSPSFVATTAGNATTTIPLPDNAFGADGQTLTGRAGGGFVRPIPGTFGPFVLPGSIVTVLNSMDEVIAETSVASVTGTGLWLSSVTTAAPISWAVGDRIRIGARPNMRVVSTFQGADTMDALSIQGVQIRYSLTGQGSASVKVTMQKTDLATGGDGKEIPVGGRNGWTGLGSAGVVTNSQRRTIRRGGLDAPEVRVTCEFHGEALVRVGDISLEVG